MSLNFVRNAFSYIAVRFWGRFHVKIFYFNAFFFCRAVPIFFLAALLFVFLCFLILSTFYTVHHFFWPEKFWSLAMKSCGKEIMIKYRYIGPFYHQFCTKNWWRFFRLALSDCSWSSKWRVLCVERSIQPVLVAYPKNLLTSKFVTSQVVEWTFLKISE